METFFGFIAVFFGGFYTLDFWSNTFTNGEWWQMVTSIAMVYLMVAILFSVVDLIQQLAENKKTRKNKKVDNGEMLGMGLFWLPLLIYGIFGIFLQKAQNRRFFKTFKINPPARRGDNDEPTRKLVWIQLQWLARRLQTEYHKLSELEADAENNPSPENIRAVQTQRLVAEKKQELLWHTFHVARKCWVIAETPGDNPDKKWRHTDFLEGYATIKKLL